MELIHNYDYSLKKKMLMTMLLTIIVVLFLASKIMTDSKYKLQLQIDHNNWHQEPFILSNSHREVYKPAQDGMLQTAFVEYVVQSLMTYSSANRIKQILQVQQYMSSELLSKSNGYYSQGGNQKYRYYSLYVVDKSATEIKTLRNKNKKIYAIKVKGVRHIIDDDIQRDSKVIQLRLQIQKTMISKSNPFGYKLIKFELNKT